MSDDGVAEVGVWAGLRADAIRYGHAPNLGTVPLAVQVLLTPGLLATFLQRWGRFAHVRGWNRRARILRAIAVAWTGADFVPGCRIGPGLKMHHPTGVVLGQGAVVGANCTLMQYTTLGERYVDGRPPHDYPVLDDNVTISVGACVLGGVQVGRGAVVGANAVVLEDVPPGAVVVGAPARVVGQVENP